jgi:glycosyltransferase involved in cell wall biosynthesis
MPVIDLDLIILTYNEELNLEHCLQSVQGLVRNVFVVDSGSADQTVEIARRYQAQVVTHPFTNQAEQFNWALDHLPLQSAWVLRLDADERLSAEVSEEIARVVPQLPAEVTGLYLKRRMIFLGRWIRFGGYYPIWLLRIFRRGKARSEQKEMDEHLVLLEGRSRQLQHDFIHDDHKGLSDWTRKHEGYAARQARVLQRMRRESQDDGVRPRLFGNQTERKRWLKQNFYGRSPLFLRAFLYFGYRYFLRLGFLDGAQGLAFHFLQGCWYFFYVDAKIYEGQLSDSHRAASEQAMERAERLRGYGE